MKKGRVLDSSALIAYFEGESGGAKIRDFLKDAAEKDKTLLLSVVNWGEVLAVIERRHGKERRDEAEHLMNQMHLEIVDADKELTRVAAHLKASVKLPYSDCFAAALALTRKADLVTSDKDFEKMENQIKIEWL